MAFVRIEEVVFKKPEAAEVKKLSWVTAKDILGQFGTVLGNVYKKYLKTGRIEDADLATAMSKMEHFLMGELIRLGEVNGYEKKRWAATKVFDAPYMSPLAVATAKKMKEMI